MLHSPGVNEQLDNVDSMRLTGGVGHSHNDSLDGVKDAAHTLDT